MTEADYERTFPELLDRIAAGGSIGKTLTEFGILKQASWYLWLDQSPIRSRAYGRAQAAKAEALADAIIPIADEDGDPQRARNRISARQWLASKYMPKKFGDKLDVSVEHVDLGGTLIEARKRSVLLPASDQAQISPPQDVDYTDVTPQSATDTESAVTVPAVNPFD